MRRLVTLTTDFGLDDSYVGQMKGVILKINPEANIVDITHHIPAYDVFKGALVLNACYKYFPERTVHLAVVDPTVGSPRRALLVQTKDHFFVGPDNGIFSFIYEREKIKEILKIENEEFLLHDRSSTFHGRDVFSPVAAHLSLGINAERFGPKADTCVKLKIPSPTVKKDSIRGEIVYIDSFGNLITNISSKNLECFSGRRLVINIANRKIKGISRSYSEARPKEILALVGSSGYLEISAWENGADRILNMKTGDEVILKPETL